jgi:hypothetical protein
MPDTEPNPLIHPLPIEIANDTWFPVLVGVYEQNGTPGRAGDPYQELAAHSTMEWSLQSSQFVTVRAATDSGLLSGQREWKITRGGVVEIKERPVRGSAEPELVIVCLGKEPWTPPKVVPADAAPANAAVTVFFPGLRAGEPSPRPLHRGRAGRPRATVLGAGITGLTAAHELAERGFIVQVIEKSHASPVDPMPGPVQDVGQRYRAGMAQPDVGGIARTQWATAPRRSAPARAARAPAAASASAAPVPVIPHVRSVHGDGHWFGAGTVGPLPPSPMPGLERGDAGVAIPYIVSGGSCQPADGALEDINGWLAELEQRRAAVIALQFVLVVYRARPGTAADALSGLPSAVARLDALLKRIEQDTAGAALGAAMANLDALPVARIDVELGGDEAAAAGGGQPVAGLILRFHESTQLVSGEHGFRFFPGFYRNLRNTMQRTPIFDDDGGRFTWRTVDANLKEVEWQVIDDHRRPHATAFARKDLGSIGALVQQYEVLRKDLGYRPSDLLRFTLRLLRYATSSPLRRQRWYETMSWWEFLSRRRVDRCDPKDELPFGQRFKTALLHMPTALVATQTDQGDARTLGNVSVQLFMDQFGLHGHADETLEGPTSEVWLRHWRDYLVQLGVQFFVGEATELSCEAGKPCQVVIEWPDGRPPRGYFDPDANDNAGERHYHVCALDVVGAARLTHSARAKALAAATEDLPDLGVITELAALLAAPGTDRPRWPSELEDIQVVGALRDRFQTFSGVQLYFEERVAFANGHIYYAESPYGLSAVSQIQYWSAAGADVRAPLLGNLSIDLGIWRGGDAAPPPNELPPHRLAQEVWRQVTRRHVPHAQARTAGRGSFERRPPACFHIDDLVQYRWHPAAAGAGELRPGWNRSPYLVNLQGEQARRPCGEPWSTLSRSSRDRRPGDGLHFGTEQCLWAHRDGGYVVHFDNLVFAGTYMRTFTRLGTMESANESARHAVNAVLDHATYLARQAGAMSGLLDQLTGSTPIADGVVPADMIDAPHSPRFTDTYAFEATYPRQTPGKIATRYGDYCDTWDPETHEIPDLDFLRDIDRHLVKQHLERQDDDLPESDPDRQGRPPPHLFDLLHLDDLPDHLDTDHEVRGVLDLLGAGLAQLRTVTGQDLTTTLATVDQLRHKVLALVRKIAAPARPGAPAR